MPLLTRTKELKEYAQEIAIKRDVGLEKVFTSTDANWGCTIRVGQMMLCQTLMRHGIGEDLRMDFVVNDYLSS